MQDHCRTFQSSALRLSPQTPDFQSASLRLQTQFADCVDETAQSAVTQLRSLQRAAAESGGDYDALLYLVDSAAGGGGSRSGGPAPREAWGRGGDLHDA